MTDVDRAPVRPCSVEGCSAEHLARGLCSRHYKAATRPSRADPDAQERRLRATCAGCGGEMYDDFERPSYVLGCETCTERRSAQGRAGSPRVTLEPRKFFEVRAR